MKSWVCQEANGEVCLKDYPIPSLKSPEDDYSVVVKMVCSSVNPVDFKRANFSFLYFPARLGSDILGKVVQIGSKVDASEFQAGKTYVLGLQNLGDKDSGSFSEYTKCDSRYITAVSDDLMKSQTDRYQIACLPVGAYTAYQIVVHKLKLGLEDGTMLKKAKNVVVTAGSGGVGGYTLQMLAEWRKKTGDEGIRIIATGSKKNEGYVRGLGATHFVDYSGDIAQQLIAITGMEKGVDIWIDMISIESLKQGIAQLRFAGEAVTILGTEGIETEQFFSNQYTLHVVALGMVYFTGQEYLCKELKTMGIKCLEMYRKGILHTHIERVVNLEGVKEALEVQKKGHVRGKQVVDLEGRSFLNGVNAAPPDSILGLNMAFKDCQAEKKVNLGVGAYRDDSGKPVVLKCVKQAEKIIFDKNLDNEYLQPDGYEQFITLSLQLAYTKENKAIQEGRIAGFQTLSGTGGLQIGFAFLKMFLPNAVMYLPNPTWPNHNGIASQLSLCVKSYRYYDAKTNGLDFKGMMEDLRQVAPCSVILLHACSHNPTGIDPSQEQWKEIRSLCVERQLIVFFDMAYQGFTSGSVDTDAWAVRYFSEMEQLVIFCVQSYAKNMGLYGQRIGCLSVICADKKQKEDVLSQLKVISRRVYSNPPLHGARIVSEVLGNQELKAVWLEEVKGMADRIISMRELFVKEVKAAGSQKNWEHIVNQKGMFAFTGVNPEQVKRLKEECSLFMTGDGRISIAGLNTKNCKYVAESFYKVTQ